jgi:hypothetical protein
MRTGIVLFLALLGNPAFAATLNSPSAKLVDVKATVAKASAGDTVVIPTGIVTWNGTLSVNKSLILRGQGPTLTIINRPTTITQTNEFITIDPSSDVPVRVTGIGFNNKNFGQNYNRLPCISVAGTTTELTQIRVDHCSFKGGVSTVEWFNWAYGVVDQRWRARNIPTGW